MLSPELQGRSGRHNRVRTYASSEHVDIEYINLHQDTTNQLVVHDKGIILAVYLRCVKRFSTTMSIKELVLCEQTRWSTCLMPITPLHMQQSMGIKRVRSGQEIIMQYHLTRSAPGPLSYQSHPPITS
jgi:hypothetical protein